MKLSNSILFFRGYLNVNAQKTVKDIYLIIGDRLSYQLPGLIWSAMLII